VPAACSASLFAFLTGIPLVHAGQAFPST
jgi:hypothetical protein